MKSSRLVLSVAILLMTFALVTLRSGGEAVPIRKPLRTLPTMLGPWETREVVALEPKILEKLKLNDYLVRRYVDATGRSLWTYIGYWETQRKNALIHSPKNCLPGNGWEPLEASRVSVALPPPHRSITINRYLIQKDLDRQLVFYWYESQGQSIAGEIGARVAMMQNAMIRNRTDGALVRISSPIYGSVAETSNLLAAYVGALYPVLGEVLPN